MLRSGKDRRQKARAYPTTAITLGYSLVKLAERARAVVAAASQAIAAKR